MKKNRQIIIYILIIVSILASLYFDSQLIIGVSHLRNVILDNFFMIITFVSSEVLIFFVLTALFLWRENKRRWILPLWITLGFSALISFILKITVQRQRPFQLGLVPLLESLEQTSFSTWSFSFPSSHAMIAFCAIPILSEQFPKLKKLWIALAVLIAFSRIYFGVHFFSDVITGGLIGYVIGLIIVKAEKETKFGKKVYEKIFRK